MSLDSNVEEKSIKKKFIRVNEQITAPRVRVINPEGQQIGIVNIKQALELALEEGLDLVEVSPNSNPPVCKIMDYGKYKYELSKRERSIKKKQHTIQVKEIRFRPKIEEHDFEFKTKHARKFLTAGNKVKVTVVFKGREMAHQEFGQAVLERVIAELSDIAKVEREPQLEGKNMILILTKK